MFGLGGLKPLAKNISDFQFSETLPSKTILAEHLKFPIKHIKSDTIVSVTH